MWVLYPMHLVRHNKLVSIDFCQRLEKHVLRAFWPGFKNILCASNYQNSIWSFKLIWNSIFKRNKEILSIILLSSIFSVMPRQDTQMTTASISSWKRPTLGIGSWYFCSQKILIPFSSENLSLNSQKSSKRSHRMI